MPSTTPAPEREPRGTGAEGPDRRAAGEPMRALLAACAAAEAVSTPPGRRPPVRRPAGSAQAGSAQGEEPRVDRAA
ncbi:hypothetical protein GCM10009639_19770 [Kitasatospora putterlickiae]|uniref:Uncharacterized protein n=1 Tax=Kitasatospora putterlickiae TaxID=221725 RepID=A0ABN1XVA2_9ACTN